MPTKNYKNLSQAYKALTDIEIMDDDNDYPVASIKVKGLGKVKITMLSEWDYYNHFIPMQQAFISYYANALTRGETEMTDKKVERIRAKVNAFVNEISLESTKEGLLEKARELTFLFDDPKARRFFFKKLKAFGVLPWWIGWKRYQKKVRPIDTMAIFVFLWSFNVDGLKKNAKFLLAKISAIINTESPTESRYFESLDSFKEALAKAKEKERQNSSKESSTSGQT